MISNNLPAHPVRLAAGRNQPAQTPPEACPVPADGDSLSLGAAISRPHEPSPEQGPVLSGWPAGVWSTQPKQRRAVKELMKKSQAELDDLFRQKPGGPVPDGEAKGTALIWPGTKVSKIIAETIRLTAWQGKVFHRDPQDSERGTLKNRIGPFGNEAIKAYVYKDKSWLDGGECIVLDYSQTSLVAKKIRDEIREVEPGVYLGIVWWGKTRTINFALDTR